MLSSNRVTTKAQWANDVRTNRKNMIRLVSLFNSITTIGLLPTRYFLVRCVSLSLPVFFGVAHSWLYKKKQCDGDDCVRRTPFHSRHESSFMGRRTLHRSCDINLLLPPPPPTPPQQGPGAKRMAPSANHVLYISMIS